MKSIVLLRHGESIWNKENRFTGWTDVDLTEKGVAEAYRAGNLLKEKGYVFNKAYTSYLKRAVKTLKLCIGSHGPRLDPGGEELDAERETLRIATRVEQERDRPKVWRRAGLDLASQLRYSPASPIGRRPS